MKIERDKWYLTEGGDRRHVICVDASGIWPVVAIDEKGSPYFYNSEGVHRNEFLANPIAPAPEPVRGYVAFTRDGLFVGHATKTEAFGPSLRILDLSTAKEVG